MSERLIEEWLRRIRLGEDSTLELKRVMMRGPQKVAEPHPDGISDELAALANASGGTMILGVDDKSREVIGIDLEAMDAVESWVTSVCRDRIVPALDVVTRHYEFPDATGALRPVIVVEVPRSLWVHKSANGYFKRVGHAKREMAPEVLARLFQQRSQARLIRFEEQAVPGTSPNDLDPLLARAFLREGEGEAEVQLRRLHLIVDDAGGAALSVAGVLLGTVKPVRWLPAAYIQAVAYRGTQNDPAEQVDAKDFDGPIQQQIWDAFDFVKRHMQVPASKQLGRAEHPQYSLRAVFEAIVNAVAHRDYSMANNRIRLHLFADRLELYTPGALPNSLTIEAMPSVSIPRNEIIASLFARYFPVREQGLSREFLMDKRGAGVDIILKESEALAGKRPVYEILADVDLRLTVFAASMPNREESIE